MIRRCKESDFDTIFKIINDAAQAYKGVIPEDRWDEPYMSFEELRKEIEDGVFFWGLEHDGQLLGIMGIQDKGDVTLIRHTIPDSGTGRDRGSALWVHDELRLVEDESGNERRIAGALTDITDIKEKEAEERRVMRSFRLLSRCNEAVVQGEKETMLMQEICRLLVKEGECRKP